MNKPYKSFTRQHNPARMQGLTLVELMIAMTLGMLIIVAIGYAYLGTRTSFRQQDALGRMQENARFVFEMLTNDIRLAGFAGSLCGQAESEIALQAGWDEDLWNRGIFKNPLLGYEDASATAPDVSADVYKGDALAILHADGTKDYVVTVGPAGGGITFAGDAPDNGDVVVTGCGNAKPRQAFAFDGSNNLTTALAAQSRIMPLAASLYYIRLNSADPAQPALYRRNGAGASDEMVEGVEDMQVTYGVDTSNPATCSDNDGGVDSYVTADNVEATVPCGTAAEDWKKVLSVRVTLVMRSVEDGIATESSTFTYEDGTTVTDRRLRKTFTTTIAVRNRL